MPRNFHRPTLALIALLPVACRSSGDFRARTLPDPIPIHEASGRAYFTIELQSLSRHEVRVGRDGLAVPPGGRVLIPFEAGADASEVELLLTEQGSSRDTTLRIPLRLVRGPRLQDLDYPIPGLGGKVVQVTAGFHAPNHRRPGRRLALDLVPVLPEGQSAMGTEVHAPFRALVVAFTEEEPDRPGSQPNEILLRDEKGRFWRYAHFQRDSIPLQIDRWVEKGALLGRIGLSGHTTGPHLHIELLTPPGRKQPTQ